MTAGVKARILSLAAVWIVGCAGPQAAPAGARALESVTIGRSVRGAPIEARVLPGGEPGILIIGGVHGDEPIGTALVEAFEERVRAEPALAGGRLLVLVPRANPDGLAAGTRRNARGVDVNRNFPAPNFAAAARHGSEAASEPETRALVELLAAHRFACVISIHAPLRCVDYDGEGSRPVAEAMSAAGGLPLRRLGGLPGSLGTYAGAHLGLRMATYELGRRRAPQVNAAKYFEPHVEALCAAVRAAAAPPERFEGSGVHRQAAASAAPGRAAAPFGLRASLASEAGEAVRNETADLRERTRIEKRRKALQETESVTSAHASGIVARDDIESPFKEIRHSPFGQNPIDAVLMRIRQIACDAGDEDLHVHEVVPSRACPILRKIDDIGELRLQEHDRRERAIASPVQFHNRVRLKILRRKTSNRRENFDGQRPPVCIIPVQDADHGRRCAARTVRGLPSARRRQPAHRFRVAEQIAVSAHKGLHANQRFRSPRIHHGPEIHGLAGNQQRPGLAAEKLGEIRNPVRGVSLGHSRSCSASGKRRTLARHGQGITEFSS